MQYTLTLSVDKQGTDLPKNCSASRTTQAKRDEEFGTDILWDLHKLLEATECDNYFDATLAYLDAASENVGLNSAAHIYDPELSAFREKAKPLIDEAINAINVAIEAQKKFVALARSLRSA